MFYRSVSPSGYFFPSLHLPHNSLIFFFYFPIFFNAVRWRKIFWKPGEIVTRFDVKPSTTSATPIVNVDTSSVVTATTNIGKTKEVHQKDAISLYWMIIIGCLVVTIVSLLTISAVAWCWRKQLVALCKSLLSRGEWFMFVLQPCSTIYICYT